MNATPTTTEAPTPTQTFNHYSVRIRVNKAGQRAAEITPFGRPSLRQYVPLELLALAAGKDAWMRNIQFKCASCRKLTVAGDTEGGEYCQACFDAQGEENARLDGGAL